jgi:hypothetical protein
MNTVFMTYLDFLSPEFFADTRILFKDAYFSTGATLINVILGFGMFLLSIATFKRRKLYFE